MSPQVGNFVHDLVEMAKAQELLPQVRQELEDAKAELERHASVVQRLETKLIDRNTEISDLHKRIHDLEVSRDDAELRFLLCDDAKSSLVRTIENVSRELSGVLLAVNPPVETPKAPEPESQSVVDPTTHSEASSTPEPTTHTEPPSHSWAGQSEPTPTVDGTETKSAETVPSQTVEHTTDVSSDKGPSEVGPTATDTPTSLQSAAIQNAEPQSDANTTNQIGTAQNTTTGQSEPHPTPATTTDTGTNTSAQQPATHTENVSSPDAHHTTLSRYAGKNYYDMPYHIPLHKWIEGGGTHHDYYNSRKVS